MKRRFIFLIVILFPLLLSDCGGNKITVEVPPPKPVEKPDDTTTPDTPGDEKPDEKPDETHPWDANRGKVVTPSGTGWTTSTVADGVVYYAFSGKDALSNSQQKVYVVDLDLSNPKYAVKLTYYNPSVVVSQVFKDHNNAVAAINAGYDLASIVVKVDGKVWSMMPNNVIGTTTVPQWKDEGALYIEGDRDITIAFDGKGKTIAQQRSFYNSSKHRNIITSAPMLIDDFEPVGETFADAGLTSAQINKLDYEDPLRHQGVRHPRTVVAKTENNHFLMIAIDGRRTSSAGMTAKEVTQFLVKHFNPQYALNMDGGGSTALCVRGLGKADTHLVNAPTDEEGERKRDTHFVIVEK